LNLGGGLPRQALAADGIPFTSFGVEDAVVETARLKKLGVVFVQQPTVQGPATTAILDDTCGNLIQIVSMNP
jgi:predicted enzyme related to lactoylglutathione lyase